MTMTKKNGDVIEMTDTLLSLTKGKQNYCDFTFTSNKIEESNLFSCEYVNSKVLLEGDTDAVKVVDYSKEDNFLSVTVKQVKENLGKYAELKVLLFNDGELVDYGRGFYSIYAEDLTGKNSEATMTIPVWETDYSDVQFFFEDR